MLNLLLVFSLSENSDLNIKFQKHVRDSVLERKNRMHQLKFLATPVPFDFFPFYTKPKEIESCRNVYFQSTSKAVLSAFFVQAIETSLIFSGSILLYFLSRFSWSVWVGLLYLWVFLGALLAASTYWYMRRTPYTWLWQSSCFYYSASAAEFIENSKLVEGSWYVDNLLSFLDQYCKIAKTKVGSFEPKIKAVFDYSIEKLCSQKSAVIRAIRENPNFSNSFANHLYMLAYYMFGVHMGDMREFPGAHMDQQGKTRIVSDPDPFEGRIIDLDKCNASLCFLMNKSKKYFHKETFLQRHPKANLFFKGSGEIVQLILIPIVIPFLLWLIFGYGKT